MAWSTKNYQAYLRAAQAKGGLTYRQAQAVYREQKAIQGRSLFARDVQRHPKYFARAVKAAETSARRLVRAERRAEREFRGEVLGSAGRETVISREELADTEDYYGGEETEEEAEY